jgi:hypothetical protein
MRAKQRRITLESVEGLGGRWTGSLQKLAPDRGWEFDLSAERLDASEFYSWLGAQGRPNLLQRVLPFGAGGATDTSSARMEALAGLNAGGRLRIAELDLARLHVFNIDANSKISGAALTLRQGHAEAFGGQWSGNFVADLSAEPAYSFEGQFARLDLSQLAEAVALSGRASGAGAGELKLRASGNSRAALVGSLQGQGTLRAPAASLPTLEFASTANPGESEAGAEERPAAIAARFHLGNGSFALDSLQFARPAERTEVSGSIDFARRLDLRVATVPRALAEATPSGLASVSGTLDAPRIVSAPVAASSQRPPAESTIANR